MGIFAISDLHLSAANPKPMDIFGSQWTNHTEKLRTNIQTASTDVILMPGDLSWAKDATEAAPDLQWIDSLPGKKIVIRGNHDYWYNPNKTTQYPSITFLKNDFAVAEGRFAICGTRGWVCPNDTYFTADDEKIYRREALRLERVIGQAKAATDLELIVLLHFPPTNDKKEPSLFTEIIDRHQITRVIYGHLHGEESFNSSYQGMVGQTEYRLVSADFLDFRPLFVV